MNNWPHEVGGEIYEAVRLPPSDGLVLLLDSVPSTLINSWETECMSCRRNLSPP
jgi:hypothetical protein